MFADVAPYLPQLFAGLLVTLTVACGSFVIGLVLAGLTIPLRISGPLWARRMLAAYVALVRGLPELLIIFVVFYGGSTLLSRLAGRYVEFDALAAGITALSVVATAYISEILRAALLAIPPGQWEAAQSLGLGPLPTYARVIVPQMLARALPGLANQWLIVLKDSALVSIVGLEDLMRKSVTGAGATHNPLAFYLVSAALYVGVTTLSSAALEVGGRRLAPGLR